MNDFVIPLMIAAIVGLCATVAALVGWIGSRINVRLEKIDETLAAIERNLRGELFGLDRRVTRLESHCEEMNKKSE